MIILVLPAPRDAVNASAVQFLQPSGVGQRLWAALGAWQLPGSTTRGELFPTNQQQSFLGIN